MSHINTLVFLNPEENFPSAVYLVVTAHFYQKWKNKSEYCSICLNLGMLVVFFTFLWGFTGKHLKDPLFKHFFFCRQKWKWVKSQMFLQQL